MMTCFLNEQNGRLNGCGLQEVYTRFRYLLFSLHQTATYILFSLNLVLAASQLAGCQVNYGVQQYYLNKLVMYFIFLESFFKFLSTSSIRRLLISLTFKKEVLQWCFLTCLRKHTYISKSGEFEKVVSTKSFWTRSLFDLQPQHKKQCMKS